MNRRTFLYFTIATSLASTLPAQGKKATRILLCSSWQTVNIGDIVHTPGMLTLLEKHRPDTEVTLWPSSVGGGVEEILQARRSHSQPHLREPHVRRKARARRGVFQNQRVR